MSAGPNVNFCSRELPWLAQLDRPAASSQSAIIH